MTVESTARIGHPHQEHPAEPRLVRPDRENCPFLFQFSLKRAMSFLMDEHFVNRTPVADDDHGIHGNRIPNSLIPDP